ncbi:MAG: hypothetical protein SFW36_05900 [Leptolyngbyaceae cyanobacterium bins.59]|nr:hypothetical protein [Leptolyngbyaceae cyanobacterium bins.59]
MVDPIDDVARQARQGSVAAVIQVLNEKLADQGVRTRAVFSDGVLQLLCEAQSKEELEPSILIGRVKQILESLAPRNIRRVRINSRLVREQQLLWLEEISRDPENQLLWSELITLAKPNPIARFFEDLKDQARSRRSAMPQSLSQRQVREQRQFWRGWLGGAGVSVLLVAGVFAAWYWSNTRSGDRVEAEVTTASPSVPVAAPAPAVSPPPARPPDPFAEAVRLAEQASSTGQTAQSAADWLTLAAKWQQASDLMKQVSNRDQRYRTAQNRAEMYRKNSQSALQMAQSRRN